MTTAWYFYTNLAVSVLKYQAYDRGVVRYPLTPGQIEAGKRLGVLLRTARADRDPVEVAQAAGISPETLRKIETGRLSAPAFGTIVGLSDALELPLDELAMAWRDGMRYEAAG